MEIDQPEEIDIFKNIKRDTDSSISMIYVQDKKTQKPFWTSNRYEQFLQLLNNNLDLTPESENFKQIHKLLSKEKHDLTQTLYKHIPYSMRQELRKKLITDKIKKLSRSQSSPYNQNTAFKTKFHKLIDMFGSRN